VAVCRGPNPELESSKSRQRILSGCFMQSHWITASLTIATLTFVSISVSAQPPKQPKEAPKEVTRLLGGKHKVTYIPGKPVYDRHTGLWGRTDPALRDLAQIPEYRSLKFLDLGGSWTLTDSALRELSNFP